MKWKSLSEKIINIKRSAFEKGNLYRNYLTSIKEPSTGEVLENSQFYLDNKAYQMVEDIIYEKQSKENVQNGND
jgi:predicted polyphosphate/ATP-dependent NAD kinase